MYYVDFGPISSDDLATRTQSVDTVHLYSGSVTLCPIAPSARWGDSPALREAEGGRVTDPTYSGTVSVSGVCDPVSPLWVLFPYHSRCNNLFGHYIILSYPILYLLLFFIFCYSSSMRLMIYLSPFVFSMIHPCSSSVLLRNSL